MSNGFQWFSNLDTQLPPEGTNENKELSTTNHSDPNKVCKDHGLASYPVGSRYVPVVVPEIYVHIAETYQKQVKEKVWDKLEEIDKSEPSIDQFEEIFTNIEDLLNLKTFNSFGLLSFNIADDMITLKQYVVNSSLIPTLLVLEKHSDKLDKTELVSRMSYLTRDFAKDSFGGFRFIEGEIMKSMININGVGALSTVKDLLKDIDTERKQHFLDEDLFYKRNGIELEPIDSYYTISPEEEFLPENLTYSDGELCNLHKSIINHITHITWSAEEKPLVAKYFSQALSYDSSGTLIEYTEAFNKIGSEISFPYLLENLRSEDELTRRMSAEILYKLEVGKIGITSKEGVQYFDKVYKLIKADDPDFFVRLFREEDAYVQRLDGHGKIGVFDSKDTLKGAFELDINSKESVINALVSEISSKDVFLPKADETPEDRRVRENFLEIFLSGYSNIFERINNATGVKINSLDLHEQGWFVVYYSQASPEKRDQLVTYIKKYGELGLKVFLALDYGESGDTLIEYTERSNHSKDEQLLLMKNFYSIANRAFEWRTIFEKVEGGLDYKFSAELHEALLRKCSEYFKAALVIESGGGGDVTISELLKSMSEISYSLNILRKLYSKDSNLKLEGEPQVQSEYLDSLGLDLVQDARTTWVLRDTDTNSKIVVTIRPIQTVPIGNVPGGEARINFSVTNDSLGIRSRIGVDLTSLFDTKEDEEKSSIVQLDLGTGKIDSKAGIYPTQRVGRVLGLVENSEGGHNSASFSLNDPSKFTELSYKLTNYLEDIFDVAVARPELEY